VLPYSFQAPLPSGGGGLAIWSRYPLTAEVNYPGYRLGVLSARIALNGHSTTFVAVHLMPPYPNPASEWVSEIGQLHQLLGQLEGGPGPVLVAGDFNATTDQGQFRNLLGGGYGDAASDTGAGYLPTYPSDRWFPPLIAIDHVLSANLVPVQVTSLGLPGSDHRGLIVGFAT
jgi:endonuclease/exonuclease/phosphatase (EEP) superfamily protein YafD